MDEKDKTILRYLQKNGRASIQEIARATGIPITTVYNRLRLLESRGIIQGFTVLLDKHKLGKNLTAIILASVDYKELKVAHQNQEDIAQRISKLSGVTEVAIIAGQRDIMIKVELESVEQLNDFVTRQLRNLTGIGSTETLVVLKEVCQKPTKV